MLRGISTVCSVVLGLSACTLLNTTTDSPTKEDREFQSRDMYYRVSSEDVVKGESFEPYYARHKAPKYDAAKDVEDAYEATHTAKAGGTIYTQGGRYFMTNAWEYCRNLEQQSAGTSGWWAATGIAFGGAGIPAAAAGTVLTIAEAGSDDPNASALAARMSLAAGGYVASLIAVWALDRSIAGAAASAEAGRGMRHTNAADAYAACTEARATWVSSRADAIKAVKAERDYWKKKYEREAAATAQAGAAGAGGDRGEAGSAGEGGAAGAG